MSNLNEIPEEHKEHELAITAQNKSSVNGWIDKIKLFFKKTVVGFVSVGIIALVIGIGVGLTIGRGAFDVGEHEKSHQTEQSQNRKNDN